MERPVSRPFEARYHASCAAGCDEAIRPGQTVRYVDYRLVHDDCTTHEPPPERPAVVCESCWLTKPCDCEDT